MPTINYSYTGSFSPGTYLPQFDPTGLLPANKVSGEQHTLTAENNKDYHVIVPLFGPFFANGLVLQYKQNQAAAPITLLEGIDYNLAYQFIGATRGCSKAVYGGISILNNLLAGIVTLSYQSIGGNWCLNLSKVNEVLSNQIQNPRTTNWEQIVQLPNVFPVIDHEWDLQDLIGASHVVQSIDALGLKILERVQSNISNEQLELILDTHLLDNNNPHQVTKAQLGLDQVDNTNDASKPISLLQKQYIELIVGNPDADFINTYVNAAGIFTSNDPDFVSLYVANQI
jgi:hypothetical protein